MVTDELATLMRAGQRAPRAPDLADIRRRGRRRRRLRAAAVLGGAAVAAGLVGGVLLVWPPDARETVQPLAPTHHPTSVTAFEKRVLVAVPTSYEVDGTVLVPGAVRVDAPGLVPEAALDRPLRPLGFHLFEGWGETAWPPGLPRFMDRMPASGDQVLADAGPGYLTCTRWHAEGDGCSVTMLLRDSRGRSYVHLALGSSHFLQPEEEMEVFTGDDYSGRRWQATTVGGFDGTAAARVELTLVGGEKVDTTVGRGTISPGDNAVLGAYDAGGRPGAGLRRRRQGGRGPHRPELHDSDGLRGPLSPGAL